MSENKRYIPEWKKGKIIGAKDTELHLTLNVKIMIRELNAQNQRIKELESENKLKGDFRNFINEDIVRIKKENEQLKKMLDNVANYMQKQRKDMPIDDFVEWWNDIATEGL